MASRARGAMPDTWPMGMPATLAGTPWLPPAVDEVWLPWPPWPAGLPSESRGERNSLQCKVLPLAWKPASK